MATLNEQVNEIKNSNRSLASAQRDFVKLGLRPYEISLLISEMKKERKTFNVTFGVEIECFCQRNLAEQRFTSNNVSYRYEGYNHRDNKSYFKFVSDASVVGLENPIECVSPILQGKKGMNDLKACCKSLNEAGAQVNKTCGLHVHVGINDERQFVNVVKNYRVLEALIDTFMAQSRRANNSRWCQSLRGKNFSACDCIDLVRAEMDYDRYYKVNAEAYERHHTIEFRQHQGTTDFEKISHWVNFCCKLVAWSKDHVLDHDSFIYNISEIPFLNEEEKRFFYRRAQELA